MNTVQFTFAPEYASQNAVIDYYIDVDDETRDINVYVDDVDDELINGLNDEELCEFFGLESEFLIYTNRQDLL